MVFLTACNSDKAEEFPPVLSTGDLTSIKPTTAVCGGYVSDEGGTEVTARGVCWSTLSGPVLTDNKTIDGKGIGRFTSRLTGLTPTTTYYARAYATNRLGTSYGDELIFRTYTDTLIDIEGNVYNTISIGNQIWMAENLKATKFTDNTSIDLVADLFDWALLAGPGMCWYNNDADTCKVVYGALYNWYTVDTVTNGMKNLCPDGWHVPSDAEWTNLTEFLGGESIAGGKMKEEGTAHWISPNIGATGESGFTGLPGGGRFYDGTFSSLGSKAGWWSSTEVESFPWSARGRYLYYNYTHTYRGFGSKNDGFSVRCVKN